jgi:hypothetical protein
MSGEKQRVKSLRRVAAGRRNRLKRGPLSDAGREALRLAALRNRPWQHSTGPRTPAGKAKVAENGRRFHAGTQSIRKVRAELKAVRELIRKIEDACGQI